MQVYFVEKGVIQMGKTSLLIFEITCFGLRYVMGHITLPTYIRTFIMNLDDLVHFNNSP